MWVFSENVCRSSLISSFVSERLAFCLTPKRLMISACPEPTHSIDWTAGSFRNGVSFSNPSSSGID